MTAFDKFEVGDLVFSNEDHPYLGVYGESPGIVTELLEDTFGAQVEVAVELHPDYNEVRFAPEELTIVGREGVLTTIGDVQENDLIMMVNPEGELVKFRAIDIYKNQEDDLVDIYGEDADDDLETDNFELPAESLVFKVSA